MYFTTSTQGSSTPSIIGVHSWTFDKVAVGDSVEIPVTIFAPKDTAGNAYSANVALTYKRLGYSSSITESETIGFYVQEEKEWIELVFYEVGVDPDPAQPGASITFSANILNKGNIPAMYTNISLLESDELFLQPESYTYLGQIDPNSPTSFDSEATVKPGVNTGIYTAQIRISYEDEDHVPYTITKEISFKITTVEENRAPPQGTLEKILGPLINIFFPSSSTPSGQPSSVPSRSSSLTLGVIPIVILIIVIAAIVIFIRRRRSKRNEFQEALEED